MLRWLTTVVVAAIVGATSLSVVLLSLGVMTGPSGKGTLEVSYADFLAVSLTAVTVVLAALAVGVAILAMRSFNEIKLDARNAAIQVVNETASPQVSNCLEKMLADGKLDKIFEKMSITGRMSPTAQAELRPGFDPNETEDR